MLHILGPVITPLVSGLLFRAGGTDQWKWCKIPFTNILINQKLWRWLIGAVIGLLCWKGWVAYGLCIGAYFIATNLFGYGDKTPILKYLPKPAKFFFSGAFYGLASFPLLGKLAIAQSIVSGVFFLFLFYLDEADLVKNPWQELLRGFFGTILLISLAFL